MKTLFRYYIAIGSWLLVSTYVFAHHNGANTYMQGKPIEWQGTVTFVSWDGAHVMYKLAVKNARGVVESWQVLGGSPRRLSRRGIFQKTVTVGDAVTVAGYLDIWSKIVTPVYLRPSNGEKLFVGYVDSDETFSLPK